MGNSLARDGSRGISADRKRKKASQVETDRERGRRGGKAHPEFSVRESASSRRVSDHGEEERNEVEEEVEGEREDESPVIRRFTGLSHPGFDDDPVEELEREGREDGKDFPYGTKDREVRETKT